MSQHRRKIESLARIRFPYIVQDQYVTTQLDKIREEDTNAPARLYNYYLNRIRNLRENYLYPHGPAYNEPSPLGRMTESPQAGLPTLPREPERFQTEMELRWNALKDELRYVAEVIWRQYFENPDLDDRTLHRFQHPRRLWRRESERAEDERSLRRELAVFTQQARSLLLLWLEAEFYFLRAISNMDFYTNRIRNQRAMITRFRTLIGNYNALRRAWDQEIGMQVFQAQSGDAERLKALSKEFGPNRVGNSELGWVTEASAIGDELRYRYFDELQHECWRGARRWAEALWLLILQGIIGYGVRPARFIISTIVIMLAFTGAYFVSDLTDHSSLCTSLVNGQVANGIFSHDIPQTIIFHLQLAILNLTGIGDTPPPCGINMILHPMAAIVGYFFLATLSALFIGQLIDAER